MSHLPLMPSSIEVAQVARVCPCFHAQKRAKYMHVCASQTPMDLTSITIPSLKEHRI
jgi:hypothetical protein